ncbi:MAG: class I SAM-dependent methyltransferase [Lysobacteraceae bacterium]
MSNIPRKKTHEHLDELSDLSSRTYGEWPIWKHTIPFPSTVMMGSSGTHLLETFLVVGSAWWQVVASYLPSESNVLDIGCGCAKVARFLAVDPRVSSYVGFDPIKSAIEWSQRFVLPRSIGSFRFEHVDIYSAEYNPEGKVRAVDYRFPARDGDIDIAIASSLFTHLLEPDARHYLAESARVLKPSGRLLLSLHDEPPVGVPYSGDEARIDVDVSYFLEIAERVGLRLVDDLGSLCGQRAVVLGRKVA